LTSARALAIAALGLTIAACGNVLGFESATLDPLTAAGGAGPTGGAWEGGAPGELPPFQDALCKSYCDTVLRACPSDAGGKSFAVYDSRTTCERQCALFATGTPGDEAGNSIACRLTNARIADTFPGERATACPAAGPGGAGICGDNLESYCMLAIAICGAYDSVGECLLDSVHVPDLGGFDISQVEGDSLQCRLYHLEAALVSPVTHCPHVLGASPCAKHPR
jgi:hypothetical protein